MKRKPGPIVALIKTLLTLLYGVPLLWIVYTSFRPSSDRKSVV